MNLLRRHQFFRFQLQRLKETLTVFPDNICFIAHMQCHIQPLVRLDAFASQTGAESMLADFLIEGSKLPPPEIIAHMFDCKTHLLTPFANSILSTYTTTMTTVKALYGRF